MKREYGIRSKGKSYVELANEMSELATDALLELLNAKSSKVGDTASTLISQRNEEARIVDSILKGQFTTRNGKVRAANTICFGKIGNEATDRALLYLVCDKNEESAGNALFSLVAMRRSRVIPELEKIKDTSALSFKMKSKIILAIKALTVGDPKIYSPHYGG